MSALVAVATGNLTASATWLVDDATSRLLSTSTSSTALTTSAQDSATFTPGAITVVGVLLKLAARNSGTPTNTLTVTLRDSTGATDVATVVINVSDLPVCSTTNAEGGWFFAKFSAPVALTAAHAYVVRCLLSSTSTPVSVSTNGTAHNWQRVLATNTNQAPVAGDDMFIAPIYSATTNPATKSTVTVTMDSTAATDYGSGVTGTVQPSLSVSDGCTLTFGTTAATNYILQVSGNIFVYSNGTFNVGTSGTPIPRGSTATIQLDCAAADLDFRMFIQNGSIVNFYGQSRTSGKNVVQTLMIADAAATTTSISVADDTGWLNGDEIAIASSDQTATHAETVTLSADAGASSISIGALANAHKGDTATGIQAEVILLTRNITFKSTSTTFLSALVIDGGTINLSWVLFRNCGASSTAAIECTPSNSTSLTFTIDKCVFRDSDATFLDMGGIGGTTANTTSQFSITDICGYNFFQGGGNGAAFSVSFAIPSSLSQPQCTIGNVTLIGRENVSLVRGMDLTDNLYNTGIANPILFTGTIRISGAFYGLEVNTGQGTMYNTGDYVVHTCAKGIYLTGSSANHLLNNVTAYYCTNMGIDIDSSTINATFTGTVTCIGNATGIELSGALRLRIKTLKCYGSTDFAQSIGLNLQATGDEALVRIGTMIAGVASGLLTTHSTADIHFNAPSYTDIVIISATLSSATTISNVSHYDTLNSSGWQQYMRIQNLNGAGFWATCPGGYLQKETTTVDVSPSVKMTPLIHANFGSNAKLESNLLMRGKGFMVPVASGATITPSVKVQKDGSYTGNAPRLILKSNPDIGVTSDTVLATHSAASGTWQTLSGTSPSATADGVMEFVVDCDGDAGNIYIDSWSQTGAATLTDSFCVDGLPFNVIGGGTPPASSAETSYGSFSGA